MNVNNGLKESELVIRLVRNIKNQSHAPVRIMEFCGGHTHAIMKYGLRQLLPPTVKLVSGPGCPVCVTDTSELDKAIALARLSGVMMASFGDLLRVPGSRLSLQQARAEVSDIYTVYSTLDALKLARQNPDKKVIFIGIGFETTAPTVAASVLQAAAENLPNYCVLSLHKLCPPVIKALLDSGEVKLDGLICPGHVSAIIGSHPWEFIARNYRIPCVVTGFEPVDILTSINMLVEQIARGESRVENAYSRGVKPEGNTAALNIMNDVFEPTTARWRGIGEVAGSGLKIRQKYERFDADMVFEIEPEPVREIKGCLCGDILRGVKTPDDCPLFQNSCNPTNPIGPCMASSEGACAAYYNYGDICGR
jgi:hydrogenase expression/formation protein HypD